MERELKRDVIKGNGEREREREAVREGGRCCCQGTAVNSERPSFPAQGRIKTTPVQNGLNTRRDTTADLEQEQPKRGKEKVSRCGCVTAI